MPQTTPYEQPYERDDQINQVEHTPGPWYDVTVGRQTWIYGADGENVAIVLHPRTRPPAEREANARLLAAAPALFAACASVVGQLGESSFPPTCLDACREALRLATEPVDMLTAAREVWHG